MSKAITRATVENFLLTKGASHTASQAATSGFDGCKSDKERADFFLKLKQQYSVKDTPNKAVEDKDEVKKPSDAKAVKGTKG